MSQTPTFPSDPTRDLTQAVQRQYEDFPYPPIPVEQGCDFLVPVYSYTLAQYSRIHQFRSSQGRRILVAGCGTGYEVHATVMANPGLAEVWGVDLSRASIAIAQQRIQYHRLSRCQVGVGNLLDAQTLPEGPFDLIISCGVLHHTADPVLALRNLTKRLAPDGIMALMLYNRRGRMRVYDLRQVLEKLGIDRMPDQDKIAFTRKLMSSLVLGSTIDRFAGIDQGYYQYDENVIDNFFHANDIPFDVDQIPGFLAQADLEFLDILPSRPGSWDPEAIVSHTNRQFYERYMDLSHVDQLSVVELLNPFMCGQNLIWGCHRGQRGEDQSFDAANFRRSEWVINPLLIQFGELSYLDRRIRFSDLCSSTPKDPVIPVDLVTLYWPLFNTPNQSLVLSRYQLQRLMLPLVHHPQTGERICMAHPHLSQDHLLGCFKRWEQFRIVLRTGQSPE